MLLLVYNVTSLNVKSICCLKPRLLHKKEYAKHPRTRVIILFILFILYYIISLPIFDIGSY